MTFPNRLTMILLATALGAGVAAAQQRAVFPASYASSDATGVNPDLHLSMGTGRALFVYESAHLAIPDGAKLRAVGFRQDAGSALSARTVEIDITMSPTRAAGAGAPNFFSQALLQPTLVLPTQKVDLPAAPAPRAGIGIDVVFPLQRPYRYDASSNLAVSYVIHGNDAGTAPFAYGLDRVLDPSATRDFGHGCPTSNGVEPTLTSNAPSLGGHWVATIGSPLAGSLGVWIIGDSSRQLNDGTPLPMPLAPLGAPACGLFTDIDVVLPFATGADGAAVIRQALPADPVHHGVELFGQAFLQEGDSFVTTQAVANVFGEAPHSSLIHSVGFPDAVWGSVRKHDGTVAVFTW